MALAACCGALTACGSSGASSSTSHTSSTTAVESKTSKSGSGLSPVGTPKFARPSASEAPRSGTVQIVYLDYTIRPDTLRVKAGTTVRWSNEDEFEHNVTSVSGPQRLHSGGLPPGHTFSVKLTRTGTIHYESTDHPATMNGTIEVIS